MTSHRRSFRRPAVSTALLAELMLLVLVVKSSSASLLGSNSFYFEDSNSSPRSNSLLYSKPSTISSNYSNSDNLVFLKPHHRQKRFLYFTADRRLTFPAGTGLFLTPTLSIPFIRNMPHGYDTGMTISLPFKINFDVLGWAHEDNPYGLIPDFDIFRKKRGLAPTDFGSTEYMYDIFVEILDNLGYPGKPCLLKAVCEMREGPLSNSYGWLKDIIEWALTPSANSKSSRGVEGIAEYLEAERRGRSLDCSEYTQCPLSFFDVPAKKKKSKSGKRHRKPDYGRENELNNEIPDSKAEKDTDEKDAESRKKVTMQKENITVESLALETKMKKRMDKIQAIAMLQSFKKVIR